MIIHNITRLSYSSSKYVLLTYFRTGAVRTSGSAKFKIICIYMVAMRLKNEVLFVRVYRSQRSRNVDLIVTDDQPDFDIGAHQSQGRKGMHHSSQLKYGPAPVGRRPAGQCKKQFAANIIERYVQT